jgi:ribA/ribD-fused uncharacterized protein
MIELDYRGLIQWECNGVLALPTPKLVTGVSDCGKFCFIEGSGTGIPIEQAIPIAPEPDKRYFFFYRGPLSQWYPSRFKINNVQYTHAEQYMMAAKAACFKDFRALSSIMAAKDPYEQKMLGKGVQGFDKERWNAVAKEVVYRGNKAKFSQNPKYKEVLMATEGATLVEASPTDDIWGIGLSEADAKRIDPKNWPGTNWLGEVLTRLRDDFLKEDRGSD